MLCGFFEANLALARKGVDTKVLYKYIIQEKAKKLKMH